MVVIGRRYDEHLKALAFEDTQDGEAWVCIGATEGDSDYATDKMCWQYTGGVKDLMQGNLFLSVAANKSRVGTVALQNGFIARPDNAAGWMVPQVALAGVRRGLVLNGGWLWLPTPGIRHPAIKSKYKVFVCVCVFRRQFRTSTVHISD